MKKEKLVAIGILAGLLSVKEVNINVNYVPGCQHKEHKIGSKETETAYRIVIHQTGKNATMKIDNN